MQLVCIMYAILVLIIKSLIKNKLLKYFIIN